MIRDISIQKAKEFSFTVGEGALEIIVSLLAMILVERGCGQEGLGIYSYLFSLFFIVGYLAEFGVPRYAEREIPLNNDNPAVQSEIIANAFQSTFLMGVVCAMVFLFSAGYDTAHTCVEERVAAYLIIGVAILFRNLNRLRFSILHGYGNHEMVAKLKMVKRFFFLGSVFFFVIIRVPPSYLTLGFLGSEIAMSVLLSKRIRLPGLKTLWKDFHTVYATLGQGYRYLLTDETLDIVLYADFLVLGFFIPSWELGAYAEASVPARFFLLIPVSIRPLFRRQYCLLAAQKNFTAASVLMQKSTLILFFLHALLALYILNFFPEILHIFFYNQGGEMIAYKIFTVIIPGLIFFSAVTAQEPIYEADDQVDALKHLVLIVSLVNLLLNFYLVPFAGFFGSATATMISMFLYFFLFGRNLNKVFRIKKFPYLSAGCGIYLIANLMQSLDLGTKTEFFLIPVILFLLFFFMGFFHIEKRPDVNIRTER